MFEHSKGRVFEAIPAALGAVARPHAGRQKGGVGAVVAAAAAPKNLVGARTHPRLGQIESPGRAGDLGNVTPGSRKCFRSLLPNDWRVASIVVI